MSDQELAPQRDIDFYDPSLPDEDPGTGFSIMVNEIDETGASRNCSNLDDCFSKTFSWLPETAPVNKTPSTFLGQPAIIFTYQRQTTLYTQSWKYIYFIYKENAYKIHISTNITREKAIFGVFDQILSTFKFTGEEGVGEKTDCLDPRPQVCTMECVQNPPYICGSDGKSYCNKCQACANSKVEWYVILDNPCEVK